MFVVVGAAGNVGSAVVRALNARQLPVLAVVHSPEQIDRIEGGSVQAVAVDVRDTEALRKTFLRGDRAFLLNPPGDPAGDSEAAELETGKSIAAALDGSGLEKIVLASTYGAQAGDAIGDLSTLYALEHAVMATGIPTAINRGAYYFSNLDMLVDAAREGVLPTAFPPDMVLPMVAAEDLGRAAAERLVSGIEDIGVRNVEGPERYSFGQVAEILSRLLTRTVSVETTPREQWEASFRDAGFSAKSARSFARMTAATVDAKDLPQQVWRGRVGLEAYLRQLIG